MVYKHFYIKPLRIVWGWGWGVVVVIVIGFINTYMYAISTYYWSYEFEFRPWRGVLDTICDKVCQWLAAGQWFSPCTPTSLTNKNWSPRKNWNIVESSFGQKVPSTFPVAQYRIASPYQNGAIVVCLRKTIQIVLF